MDVRAATLEDLGTVAGFRTRFVAEMRGVDEAALPADFAERTLQNHVRSFRAGRLRSWLAWETSQPVGVISSLVDEVPPRPEDTQELQGFVTNLYVLPTHRGRGIASALLKRCIEDAETTGVRMLGLHSTAAARGLYKQMGFREAPSWLELDLTRR